MADGLPICSQGGVQGGPALDWAWTGFSLGGWSRVYLPGVFRQSHLGNLFRASQPFLLLAQLGQRFAGVEELVALVPVPRVHAGAASKVHRT